jgi:hypothetical protein
MATTEESYWTGRGIPLCKLANCTGCVPGHVRSESTTTIHRILVRGGVVENVDEFSGEKDPANLADEITG